MRSTRFVLPALVFGLALTAGAQGTTTKVGIINIQSAIVSTKDGQKAAGEIQSRFNPKKAELDKRQGDITQLQDQLNRGRNTLSEDARQKLVREIDVKTKALNRDTEDARAELDQEEQKIMSELGGRIMLVIDKFAKDNGFSVILDVSSPQNPVIFAATGIDITKDVIDLYDRNPPAATSAPSGAPSAPAAQRPPATRPIVPPATPKPKP